MKQVTIVSAGIGAETLTVAARRALDEAELLLGAPRLLAPYQNSGKALCAAYEPRAVAEAVAAHPATRCCVLVSGDSGFYSAAAGLCAALGGYAPRLLPGVSSLSYFFARLRRPWQDAALLSCHGRAANLVDAVRRNRLTFALADDNIAALARELDEAGFGGLAAWTGEQLGTAAEQIRGWTVAALAEATVASPVVLLVENPAPDARQRCGICDEAFQRGAVPMTKAEVRAVAMSRLAPAPDDICCDIGAGTGSLTVELALAAYRGRVFAIDHDPGALALVRANCRAFHIGNVEPVLGRAPQALAGLPKLDVAFIGGSGGALAEIFAALLANNPRIRLAVNAVALETVQAAQAAFAAHGITPQIAQISAARVKRAGRLHMLEAQTPVFVISGDNDA